VSETRRLRTADAWRAVAGQAERLAGVAIESLFDADARRVEAFSAAACGLYLDYSKQRLDREARDALFALAEAVGVAGARARMYAGEPVNATENRAAWHVALRWPPDRPLPGTDSPPPAAVAEVLARMRTFSEAVRDGRWTGFSGSPVRDVVNIGIGGSDLGPAMVCRALDARARRGLRCHFVSNLDSNHLASVLERCAPAQTLFVICSKTFSTLETLTNAHSAREWLLAAAGDEAAVSRHFVAVSTALERCAAFGIPDDNVFGFWDWVGGRYSLWSAIGLAIALYLGMDDFDALRAGGHDMDRHFLTAPPQENLPLLLGLVAVWNRNALGLPTLAVLPYDHALELFPAFLQQLEMESNGKGVSVEGEPLARGAAPVLWGTLGNNGQHAFYQMMHQGLDVVPSDFVVPVRSQRPLPGHDAAVVANALAQTEALMRGRPAVVVREALAAQGHDADTLERAVAHRVMPGGRPSSTLLYDRLTPRLLGSLIALYEHKVMVQAACWDINAFDQFGVELGKELASSLQPLIEAEQEEDASAHDPSTRALLARVRRLRRASQT
jgi:glucose-6-phosphate isomerase